MDGEARNLHGHVLRSRWARLGVLFNVNPARSTPDIERLILDTSRFCSHDSRLFILAVSWLVSFGSYVAGHRLKALACSELSSDEQASLGLLIETAVAAGAPRSLGRVVVTGLSFAPEPGPLFEVDRGPLAAVVKRSATPISRRWGRWVQPIEIKADAIRPVRWVLQHNPELARRAAHKGDLRSSVLEVLRRDLAGGPVSEAALARACGATVLAIRAALDDLQLEAPELVVERRRGRLGSRIELLDVAA